MSFGDHALASLKAKTTPKSNKIRKLWLSVSFSCLIGVD